MAKTRFVGLLEAKVEEQIQHHRAYVSAGSAPDYPAYREEVGYIRGLTDALTLCEQVESEME